MDKKSTPSTRGEVFRNSWKTEFNNLTKLSVEYSSFSSFSIDMPYGYVEELTKRAFISPVLNFFGHLGVSSDRGYCMDTINLNLPKGKLPYILLVSDIQTLNTFSSVKRMRLKTHYFRGRRHLKLEQKFPATVQGTYVDRRPGFYYKWDNNKVKINIRLGTTNYTQIEKQAEKLAHECNRFFMLYCL